MKDEAGFTAFVAARGPALLRLGWLLTADAGAAEDLVQEALARMVRHWDRVGTDGNPEAYARTAIRSIWVDGWRRRGGRVLTLVADVPDRPADDPALAGSDARRDVAAALALLAPRQRAVLVLRFYEDLTDQETARALGCSVSTVKSQTREALQRLRERAPWLADEFRLAGAPVDGTDDGTDDDENADDDRTNGLEVTR